jgi:ABC-type transport system involved in cytochrome c biogenesis permease subunit
VTYTAYGLLFLSLVWILLDPKGRFRQTLKETSRSAALLTVLLLLPVTASAQRTLPRETAEDFGRLYVVYNDRVSPLQTFALDFTKKLCGKRSYNGFSAEQVLAGFIFFPEDWNKEPLLKIKGGAMKDRLQLPDMCSVNTFFNHNMGGYILGPYLREAYNGNNDAFHKDVMKMDDRLMLIMELRQGKPLTLFPYKSGAPWLSPTDKLPEEMTAENKTFIQNVFNLLFEDALSGNWQHFGNIVAGMKKYQEKYGASSLPTATQTKAERLYNSVPFATILFMVCLTMAFLSVIRRRPMQWLSIGILALSFAALTLCMALRWIISGTIPMANGYETMLLMAWMIQLMALFLHRRFPIIITFGLLMSGFFLLVSHISQMDPKISHVMPVLSSPLLSLHVSIIMMAFALLSLTFIIGIFSLVMPKNTELSTQNYKLSILFLFPAMTCLGFGIFIGAIWANISWGTYWSWDPKEVWALITFMIYGIALHDKSLPWLRNPKHYHLFMVFAFLTILMTYFGVNYFLGGMHSYA